MDFESKKPSDESPLPEHKYVPYPSLSEPDYSEPSHDKRTWTLFYLLLLSTVVTTYLAGGFFYGLTLILILGSHEFGHYWASRRNKVKATLPFFIPAPPVLPIINIGTFGAFIRIKEQIPNRKALLEIGAAGPIAGFIVAVPALIIGLFLSHTEEAKGGPGIIMGGSILLHFFSKIILGVSPMATDINIELHPIAFAGWIGMLVTALNLLPIGQLDGGHVIFSLFPIRHKLLAKTFFVLLFPMGYLWAGWLFWAALIALFGFKHSPVLDEAVHLERRHKIMGWACIFIFVVTFVPVPFDVVGVN